MLVITYNTYLWLPIIITYKGLVEKVLFLVHLIHHELVRILVSVYLLLLLQILVVAVVVRQDLRFGVIIQGCCL